jgi:TPR repeat protein
MIPLPLYQNKTMMTCCSKVICDGCCYANEERERNPWDAKCPFCRKPKPTVKEIEENSLKRIGANDPVAISQQGSKCYKKGDYNNAFEYFSKAAKLGDVQAHHQLARCYVLGHGVEKDENKGIFHLEEAAIGGHPNARYELGKNEGRIGRIERAIKHWIIAANHGHDASIKALKRQYTQGRISKENFAAALRAHQAAVDATKSPQRDAAPV